MRRRVGKVQRLNFQCYVELLITSHGAQLFVYEGKSQGRGFPGGVCPCSGAWAGPS